MPSTSSIPIHMEMAQQYLQLMVVMHVSLSMKLTWDKLALMFLFRFHCQCLVSLVQGAVFGVIYISMVNKVLTSIWRQRRLRPCGGRGLKLPDRQLICLYKIKCCEDDDEDDSQRLLVLFIAMC